MSMWGRLSSLAANPNLAQLSRLTKDGIGQLSKLTNDVLAEVKAVEAKARADDEEENGGEADGWFGHDDDEAVNDTRHEQLDANGHSQRTLEHSHTTDGQHSEHGEEEEKQEAQQQQQHAEGAAESEREPAVDADKSCIEISAAQHDEPTPPHTPIERVSTPLQHRSDTPVSAETAAEQNTRSTNEGLLDVTFSDAREERAFSTDSASDQPHAANHSASALHIHHSAPTPAPALPPSTSASTSASYSSTFPLTSPNSAPLSDPPLSSQLLALQAQLQDERRLHEEAQHTLAELQQRWQSREAEMRVATESAEVREEEWSMKAVSMEEMVQRLEEERSALVEQRQAWLEKEREEDSEHEREQQAAAAAQAQANESVEQLRDEYERLQREMQAVRDEHEQTLRQLQQAQAEYRHSEERQREALTAMEAQLASQAQAAQQASEQMEEERRAVQAEKAALEQQVAELQQQLQTAASSAHSSSASDLSSSTSASSSSSPTSAAASQTAMITQLHAAVEKRTRIIHRLTTERNDLLTVVLSVHNGVMAFAERNGLDTSEAEQSEQQPSEEQSGRESEEDRRRKLQPLLDKVLAQVQTLISEAQQRQLSQQQPPSTPVRSSAAIDFPGTPSMPSSPHLPPSTPVPSTPPPASASPSPVSSPTSPSLSSLQSQLSALRASYESEKAENGKLRRIQEAMVAWKEKASAAMARMKEDRDNSKKAALLKIKEVNDEWERRWQEVKASEESEAEKCRASEEGRSQIDAQLYSLKDLLRTSEEQCASLQQQVKALQLEVESVRAGQAKAAEGEEATAALRVEMDGLRRALENERQQSASTASQLEQLQASLQQLETQHSAAVAALEEQLAVHSHTIATLEREMAEEKERTEHGWDERDEQWKAREDEYMAERQEWQRQIEESSARIDEAREEVRLSKESEVAALEGKLREMSRQMEEERRKEKRERLLLEGRIRELIDEKDRERAEKEAEMAQAQQAGNSQQLEAALRDKQATLDSLQQQYELLAAEHAQHEEQLDTLSAEVEARRQREDEKDAELSALHLRLADAEQSSDKLRVHLKEATATVRQQYDEALQDIERLTLSVQQYAAAEEQQKAVAELCEQLSYQLEQKDGECRANTDALNNLHGVLEAFQHEQEQLKSRLEREVDEWREKADRGEQAAHQLSASQHELETLSAALAALQSQLLDTQHALWLSQQEAGSLRASIAANASRLQLFSSDTEYSIDRRLVVKMLLTFFERQQKDDVLQLMYRVLGLSDEERARIERARKGKGIGGRLYGLTSYLNPFDAAGGAAANSALSVSDDASLADLWVDFLLKEAEQQQSAREQAATVVPSPATDSTAASTEAAADIPAVAAASDFDSATSLPDASAGHAAALTADPTLAPVHQREQASATASTPISS